MVDLISLLLPNFNLNALAGVIISILGAILFVVAMFVPFDKIKANMRFIGFLMILGGIVLWFGISIVQDLFSTVRSTIVTVAIIAVGFAGYFILVPPKNKKGKRK